MNTFNKMRKMTMHNNNVENARYKASNSDPAVCEGNFIKINP